jgi:MFS family permease
MNLSEPDLRKRWTRVLPAVFITYSLAYLDRTNYGFGAAAGLAQTLHITGYQSSLLGALFFLGYCLPQIPGVILVQRHSARLLIFGALVAWGAFAALTGVIRTYWLLAADRLLLGVAESFVFPALLILLTRWFTRTERSRANALMILANPVTVLWMSAVTGFLIRARGWQQAFIVEGLVAVVWGGFWLGLMRDKPADAPWMSAAARAELEVALDREQQHLPRIANLRTAFRQRNVVWLCINYFFWSLGIYGFVLWLPVVIRNTHAPAPAGVLPLSPEMLLTEPSGNLFGLSQNAGMGWEPARLLDPEFLILSTHGGMRAQDGARHRARLPHRPLGGRAAGGRGRARAESRRATPFAGACTDPCDGRTQGTTGMLDSLPYRNDAAIVLRRLMRSLPTRKGVIGIATCDKGLPAMMMALASWARCQRAGSRRRHAAAGDGEDAAKCRPSARALRSSRSRSNTPPSGLPRLRHARRRLPVPGHRGHLAGGRRSARPLAAAHRARALRPADLARCRAPLGARDAALASARHRHARHPHPRRHAQCDGAARGVRRIDQPAAPRARHRPRRGLPRPTAPTGRASIARFRASSTRCPTARGNFATVQVFLAGGVPEVMLHLRARACSHEAFSRQRRDPRRASTGGSRASAAARLQDRLRDLDGIDPDDVIMSPIARAPRGLTSTVCFPTGNLAPEGA